MLLRTRLPEQESCTSSSWRRVVSCAWFGLFCTQSFNAGQFLALQKLQRCAAPGGDMRDLVRDSGCMHRRNGVAAADDRDCIRICGYCMCDFHCALCKGSKLEDSHRTVPYDRLGG